MKKSWLQDEACLSKFMDMKPEKSDEEKNQLMPQLNGH